MYITYGTYVLKSGIQENIFEDFLYYKIIQADSETSSKVGSGSIITCQVGTGSGSIITCQVGTGSGSEK